jgi:hypothetical protein
MENELCKCGKVGEISCPHDERCDIKPEIPNLGNIEYRGPSSHCKACEDEAAGIKHIQAPIHTCRKRKL